MKKVKYFLFIFLIWGCNNSEKHTFRTHPSKITNKRKLLVYSDSIRYDSSLKPKKNSDSIQVFFESSFKNDSVKILIGNKAVYKKVITTDDKIGLADLFKINKYNNNLDGKRTIELFINQSPPIKIDNYVNYDFLLVTLKKNRINITLTNKKSFYK